MSVSEENPNELARLKTQLAEAERATEYYRRQIDKLGVQNIKADQSQSRLNHELRQKREGFALLAAIQRDTGYQDDVPIIFSKVIRQISSRLGMDRVVVLMPTTPRSMTCAPAQWLGYESEQGEALQALSFEISAELLSAEQTLVISGDGKYPPLAEELRRTLQIPYLVAAAILVGSELIGVIVAGRLKRRSAFYAIPLDVGVTDTFTSIAGFVSVSVSNLRKEQDKQRTEIQMAGGFAHEMRNALSVAKTMLSKGLNPSNNSDAGSLCLQNSNHLRAIFSTAKDALSPEALPDFASLIQTINRNERDLHQIMEGSFNAIQRALLTTTQIMDYSQVGRTFAGKEAVEVSGLIAALLTEERDSMSTLGIELTARTPEGATIFVNSSHFYSIVSNLVLNAKDALCEVEDQRSRQIHVEFQKDDSNSVLRVTDNGPGIPEEVLPRIFDPFFTTKPATGTGLGLGMVRKLVQLYGGRVDVETGIGRGTTFLITLPNLQGSVGSFSGEGATTQAGATNVL